MAEPVENLPSPDDSPPPNVDESFDHENQDTTDYEPASLQLPFRIDYAEKLTIDSRYKTEAGDRHTSFVIHHPGKVDFQPQVRTRRRRPSDDAPNGFSFTLDGIEIASIVHRQTYVAGRRVST